METSTTTTSEVSPITGKLTPDMLPTPAPAPRQHPIQAIVDGADISRALKLIKGAIANKTTLPVLNNVLLMNTRADGSQLALIGTNLEVGITVRIPALVDDGFALTVPYKLFADTVPNKTDMLLTIDERTRTLHTEAGKTRTAYKGISAEEFPIIPDTDRDLVAVLPLALLKRAIKEVAFCASGDDSRPQLAGVYLKIEETGEVTIAAADGFRLARLQGFVSGMDEYIDGGPTAKEGAYIIPARAFAELDVLDSDNVKVELTPGRHQIVFVGQNVEVTSRLVEGNYVDIQRVIPTDFGTRIMVAADSMIEVCKALKPFATDSANIMRLQYHCGKLTGNACQSDRETAREMQVDVLGDCIGDDDFAIALNLKFVQEIVSLYKGGTLAIEGKTYQQPCVIKPGDDILFVIMPCFLPSR